MSPTRRKFLAISASFSLTGYLRETPASAANSTQHVKRGLHQWVRDARNPIFVPNSSFDSKGAQGPHVILHQGQWWMFYAGIGTDSVQRICLATADPLQPTIWTCRGPILDLGPKNSFDERSATYPCVYHINGKWHLYYSGRGNRENGKWHFSNYWGIGLAQSDDLLNWKKFSETPVLQGDGLKQYPDCEALVGLGNIVELAQPDGRSRYRMYYTLLPGQKDANWQTNGTWHVIEHKVCVAAHSFDGIEWSDRQLVLDRRRDVSTEDIGVVGLNAWKTATEYRGLYTALGTKYKTYSLAEVASQDGLNWSYVNDRNNVSLTPQPDAWDSGMIGYPCVLPENDQLRLFYNGIGGGATGIGMAVAKKR